MSRLVKLQRRYGSEWYLKNDDGDVAWVAPMVKEHIERIEAENDKLRDDLLLAHRIIGQISHEGFELIDDNKKLWELLGEAAKMYEFGEVDCGMCGRYERCFAGEATDFSPAKCEFLSLVRELGIEVE